MFIPKKPSQLNLTMGGTHFNLGGNEECCDADELQVIFVHVLLGQHEAVEVVLGEVRRLSLQAVDLTHLHQGAHTVHPEGFRRMAAVQHFIKMSDLKRKKRKKKVQDYDSPPEASLTGSPSSWAAGWGVAAGSSCRERSSVPC